MNKITKTQRDQLIGIAVAAVAIMAALWYFVVMAQERQLLAIQKNYNSMNDTLRHAEVTVRGGAKISQDLANSLEMLNKRQEDLAPEHDPYAWMLNRLQQFILPRKEVNLTSTSSAEISDKGIIPHFPYKWATFHIKGIGYYLEFGKFIADFENTFPYARIQNMDISAAPVGADYEKLSYSFDIVTPLVPTAQETK